ncbi:hypothetical protein ACFO4E_04025 [Nocardiopsis mangrovi]|uniref:Uncharacterized protein n=1 Tax=Nocardiopsis mangrovi TaxID=1179818 RepID=A0ABV9DQV0_9ACTN
MSRTDKDKPLRVRYAEHGPRPVHDHRFGPCDLPGEPARAAAGTRCRWPDLGAVVMGHTCCSGCKRRSHIKEWQRYTRAGNRRERYAGRRAARRYAAGETAD